MHERFSVAVGSSHTVGGTYYPRAPNADPIPLALFLAHGAGAGQASAFMRTFATGMAVRGADVITFDFPYIGAGRRVPDPGPVLEEAYASVVAHATARVLGDVPGVVMGGKSLGGRIASQLAAREDLSVDRLRGLLFLGYPLHPPGRPNRLRVAHFPRIDVPVLCLQGSRDAFGTPDEIRPHLDACRAGATLHPIDGADHSFNVRGATATRQAAIFAEMHEVMAAWLRARAVRLA